MKKVFILFLFILNISFSFSQQKDRYLAEDLVAIVGEQPIMMSEWQQSLANVLDFRRQYGTMPDAAAPEVEALESVFAQKLLIQCAKRDSLDKEINEMDVLSQVTELIQRMADECGGIKALEALYGKPVFQIREDVRTNVIENELIGLMQASIRLECNVSKPDVKEFFESVGADTLPTIPTQYCYAQIVCVPEATEAKQFEIRERLLEFRERVLKGERLSVLARMYSQAHDGSPQKGGEIGPIDINGLVPQFIQALEQLEPGQVSEVVETEYGYHIVELISKKGDLVHFRHLLLTPEFTPDQVQRVTHVLDSVANLIRNGELSFERAALIYSNEKESKFNGGIVFNINSYYSSGSLNQTSTYFMAEELQPLEQIKLSTMKVGDVSDSYESLNSKGLIVYKIIKLLDIRQPHKISLDYEFPYIESAALEKKVNDHLQEWIFEQLKSTYFYINADYRDLPFSQPQWMDRHNECIKESYFIDAADYMSTNNPNDDSTAPVPSTNPELTTQEVNENTSSNSKPSNTENVSSK